MKPQLYPLIASLILAISGITSGVWAYRKNRADAAESLIRSAMTIVKQYETALKEANEKIDLLEIDVGYLRKEVNIGIKDRDQLRELIKSLETQIETLGFIPKSKTTRTKSSIRPKRSPLK